MAFGLDDPQRQRAALIGLLVLGGAYAFWQYVYAPVREERIETETRLESLVRVNDQARALSQPQRMRELRAREEEHEIQLAAYATMLPARSEVGDLLEDIAGAALEQDVGIVEFAPLTPIEGEVLIELSFEIEVQGGYHEIGRFLAAIVNLPRLIRPSLVEADRREVEEATGTAPPTYEVGGRFELSTYMPAGSSISSAATNGAPQARAEPAGKRSGTRAG